MSESIVDYYGTTWTVEPTMGGPGPLVDVELDVQPGHFHRFTAEDACNLADALLRAAGYPDKATR